MKKGKCELREAHAKMSADSTVSDFEEALTAAAYFLKGAPWWIGDLLNEAERRFGEGYAQCVPTSVSESQANRLRSVASKVPQDNRKPLETLSQGHYDAAARLPVELQVPFLEQAITDGLGTNEFRNLISASLRRIKEETKERTKGV